MNYLQAFHFLSENDIPLADIKVIFDGYFHMPFDSLGINGEEGNLSKENLDALLTKLRQGYPVAYLVGYTDILKLHLFVNEDVLIPRIETADFIYSYLKTNYDFRNKKILDLCTGSGLIALAIKTYFPSADVYASDISLPALAIAKKNALENQKEITLIHSDFLNDIHDTFDVIISNPPYIEENNPDVNAPFEPKLALFSGMDGMDSYRNIFVSLDSHLNHHGFAFFELESTNSQKVSQLFQSTNKNYKSKIIKDLYNRDRYLAVEKNN